MPLIYFPFGIIYIFINMYSFENFPDNVTHANFKLTPRSNEALLRSGLKHEDLVVKGH